MTVSKVNECIYCVAHHAPRLVAQGFDPASVAAILEPAVPGFDEVDTLVRDHAAAVTKMRGGCRPGWWRAVEIAFQRGARSSS